MANRTEHLQQFLEQISPHFATNSYSGLSKSTIIRGLTDFHYLFLRNDASERQKLSAFVDAIKQYQIEKGEKAHVRAELLQHLGLNLNKGKRDEILENIKRVRVSKLKSSVPPQGFWVYEKEDIANLWYKKTQIDPLPDKRRKRSKLYFLKEDSLQYDVDENESVIFVDSESGEIVAMVWRKFCDNSTILRWVDQVLVEATMMKNNVRVSVQFCSYNCYNLYINFDIA